MFLQKDYVSLDKEAHGGNASGAFGVALSFLLLFLARKKVNGCERIKTIFFQLPGINPNSQYCKYQNLKINHTKHN